MALATRCAATAGCCLSVRISRFQLIVGSEDFEIRIFASEEVSYEATESDVVTGLAAVTGSCFGYSLANGTVGVYNNATRVWHAKSKHTPTCLSSFDLNGDGVPELIAGWSSGRLEVRLDSTGFLVYKDKMNASVASLMATDYRMDGRMQIVAVGVDGEVRGYSPPDAEQVDLQLDHSVQEAQLQALYDKKNVSWRWRTLVARCAPMCTLVALHCAAVRTAAAAAAAAAGAGVTESCTCIDLPHERRMS